jgi:hypothetical protein
VIADLRTLASVFDPLCAVQPSAVEKSATVLSLSAPVGTVPATLPGSISAATADPAAVQPAVPQMQLLVKVLSQPLQCFNSATFPSPLDLSYHVVKSLLLRGSNLAEKHLQWEVEGRLFSGSDARKWTELGLRSLQDLSLLAHIRNHPLSTGLAGGSGKGAGGSGSGRRKGAHEGSSAAPAAASRRSPRTTRRAAASPVPAAARASSRERDEERAVRRQQEGGGSASSRSPRALQLQPRPLGTRTCLDGVQRWSRSHGQRMERTNNKSSEVQLWSVHPYI